MDGTLEIENGADAATIKLPRPVFFMHIAKTAGSYLNNRFAEALGPGVVETHIEASIGNRTTLQAKLDAGVQVFSGHVMYPLWREIAGPLDADFCKVCILRDPIAHLASHIQWLDHYNLPEFAKEYRQLDELHRRLVDRIGAVDITEVGQLDALLVGLSGVGVRLLDNCQSRYFVNSGRNAVDTIRALSLADRFAVAKAADAFDLVVFQDNLQGGLQALSDLTGVALAPSEKRVNPAVSERRIDVGNPLVRQILSRRTLVDQWLYRHLRNRKSEEVPHVA